MGEDFYISDPEMERAHKTTALKTRPFTSLHPNYKDNSCECTKYNCMDPESEPGFGPGSGSLTH